ncbi:alpha/beta hydrolase family protein [Acanthopleuribacter pedis]|uniref:Alpha/beta fold hydrolase n=1 Tax=Acanthopleuribacter pedis TaxID=442870 RepID=A0A8J7U568_9BACT|nr:alpha/beta fold hydrolase [Acanthopleuribacter pedis]MBO1321407.1 alpha/beta fold hydrolase [Acanthopleuribacter pedis]
MHTQVCTLGPAPALLVSQDRPETAAAKGTVLLFHGFSVDCSVNQRELESLAARGFLAVGIDNAGHGRRRDPDWEAKFGPGGDWMRHFLQLVRQTAAEVPDILDALAGRDLLPKEKAGVTGISMGGLISYAAMLHDSRVVSATPMIATPKDVADQANRFFPAAILSQTAGLDEVVDYRDAADFHAALAPHYADQPEREKLINYPDSPHTMRENDWHDAWAKVLAWHERFLP